MSVFAGGQLPTRRPAEPGPGRGQQRRFGGPAAAGGHPPAGGSAAAPAAPGASCQARSGQARPPRHRQQMDGARQVRLGPDPAGAEANISDTVTSFIWEKQISFRLHEASS